MRGKTPGAKTSGEAVSHRDSAHSRTAQWKPMTTWRSRMLIPASQSNTGRCDDLRSGRSGSQSDGIPGITSVSLKDLCVEDKQRIAGLIKELARVGEEREKAKEELERERKEYSLQIQALVDQQKQILVERMEAENHLIQCQHLLAASHFFCNVPAADSTCQPCGFPATLPNTDPLTVAASGHDAHPSAHAGHLPHHTTADVKSSHPVSMCSVDFPKITDRLSPASAKNASETYGSTGISLPRPQLSKATIVRNLLSASSTAERPAVGVDRRIISGASCRGGCDDGVSEPEYQTAAAIRPMDVGRLSAPGDRNLRTDDLQQDRCVSVERSPVLDHASSSHAPDADAPVMRSKVGDRPNCVPSPAPLHHHHHHRHPSVRQKAGRQPGRHPGTSCERLVANGPTAWSGLPGGAVADGTRMSMHVSTGGEYDDNDGAECSRNLITQNFLAEQEVHEPVTSPSGHHMPHNHKHCPNNKVAMCFEKITSHVDAGCGGGGGGGDCLGLIPPQSVLVASARGLSARVISPIPHSSHVNGGLTEGLQVGGVSQLPPSDTSSICPERAHRKHRKGVESETCRQEELRLQRKELLLEHHRLQQLLLEQEAMLSDKQRALDTLRRTDCFSEAERRRQGSRLGQLGERKWIDDEDGDPFSLVLGSSAIDAALQRQQAIVSSLLSRDHLGSPPDVRLPPAENVDLEEAPRKIIRSSRRLITNSLEDRVYNDCGDGSEESDIEVFGGDESDNSTAPLSTGSTVTDPHGYVGVSVKRHRVMSMLEIVESLSSPPHHSRRRHAQPPPDLLNRSLSPDSTLSSRSASPTSSTGGRSTTDDMVRSVDGDGHSDDDMNGLSRGGRRTEDEVTEENKMLNDVFFSPCC